MERFEVLSERASQTLNSMKQKLDSFISQDEALWMAVAMFLFGIIVGMLISPRKSKNVTIDNRGCCPADEYCGDDCCCGDDCDDDCCCE